MRIILKPIYKINRKRKKFRWIEIQKTVFTYLKNAIVTFNKVTSANVDSIN